MLADFTILNSVSLLKFTLLDTIHSLVIGYHFSNILLDYTWQYLFRISYLYVICICSLEFWLLYYIPQISYAGFMKNFSPSYVAWKSLNIIGMICSFKVEE